MIITRKNLKRDKFKWYTNDMFIRYNYHMEYNHIDTYIHHYITYNDYIYTPLYLLSHLLNDLIQTYILNFISFQ